MTPYQAAYIAHDLTRLGTLGEVDRLSTTLFDAQVDLKPHRANGDLVAVGCLERLEAPLNRSRFPV